MPENGRLSKNFSVFDCDAHVNDALEIWTDYVEPEYRDAVKRSYWRDGEQAMLNGRTVVISGASSDFPSYIRSASPTRA